PVSDDVPVAAHSNASPVEARRARISKIDGERALAKNVDTVRAHFGGKLPDKLTVQVADLAGHRRAVFAADDAKPPSESAPLVVGDDDVPLWVKERPAAGIMAPIGPLAIAPGPHGRIALAACDPPTSSVALRLWDDDGQPFADFSTMDIEGCDALSILYWPRT